MDTNAMWIMLWSSAHVYDVYGSSPDGQMDKPLAINKWKTVE